MARLVTFLSLLLAVCLRVEHGVGFPLEHENKYALHEKRDTSTAGPWRRSERVASDSIIPLRIGLVQTNLEEGHDRVLSVSDPNSPTYAQYLSASEVHDLFSPSSETVTAVRDWLINVGIDESAIVHSENRGWFALELPALEVERLFHAEIHEYEHDESVTRVWDASSTMCPSI